MGPRDTQNNKCEAVFDNQNECTNKTFLKIKIAHYDLLDSA